MKRPEPNITEQLWKSVAPQFEIVIEALLAKGPRAKKLELARDSFALAYKSGVERGYDLGFHVFGDGGDEDESETTAETE